ncbi:MAG: M55 family metallopeptidase [Vulcanimicrobiaceae bacterium]
MKLYLSCDMEGTAGVCSWSQVDPSNTDEYPLYRHAMTHEVRCAIEGARAGGAEQFLVNDAHWNMRNLMLEELPQDARVISGSRKPLSMMQGIDESIEGAFFIGYHGKIGDENAALAHTYSEEVFYDVRVNGTPCSEALLNAAFAGTYGVPLLLISGDRSIVEETRLHMPWVVGVAVKEPIGFSSVNSMTPSQARTAIYDGARKAMTQRRAARPFLFEPPIVLELVTAGVEHADTIALMPGFDRIGGRTIRVVTDDYRSAFHAFIVALRLGATANAPA